MEAPGASGINKDGAKAIPESPWQRKKENGNVALSRKQILYERSGSHVPLEVDMFLKDNRIKGRIERRNNNMSDAKCSLESNAIQLAERRVLYRSEWSN
jgi:hypothetical protein